MIEAHEIDWFAVGGALLAGVTLAVMIIAHLGKQHFAGSSVPPPAEDLLVERRLRLQNAIQQLSSGEEAGELSPGERERLELEAARLLAELEQDGMSPQVASSGDQVPHAQPAAAPAASPPNAALRGFAWGAGTVIALVLLVWGAQRIAAPREDSPQISATQFGGDPLTEVQNLLAAGNVDAARQQLARILERQPDNARALAYDGLVRLSSGDAAGAVASAERAVRIDPNLLEASVHLAVVQAQLGRESEARATLADARARHPQNAGDIDQLTRQLFSSSAAPQMRAASGREVSGTITFAGAPPPGAILFITARAAGQTSGPPAAAKRMQVSTFPVEFSLTDADSMMGQPLPERMRIDARLDRDGDPLTKEGDPSASLDVVAVGAADVVLPLQ